MMVFIRHRSSWAARPVATAETGVSPEELKVRKTYLSKILQKITDSRDKENEKRDDDAFAIYFHTRRHCKVHPGSI